MTIVQMRYYAMVCRWQNITKAAAELHIAQSTLSLSMQNLEEETGLNLLRHSGRNIEITEDGMRLLDRVKAILTHIDRFEREVKSLSHDHNVVRVALPPQISAKVIPILLSEFHQQHPEINVELIETGMDAIDMIRREEVDITVINLIGEKHSDLKYIKLVDVPIGLIVNEKNPLANMEIIKIEEAAKLPLVLLSTEYFSISKHFFNELEKYGIEANVLFYSRNIFTAETIIKKKIANSILTKYVAYPGSGLAMVPLDPPMHLTSYAVTKQGQQLTPDIKLLIKFLKDSLQL